MADQWLEGVIDMHVHTAPDLRARRYDDFQLCRAGVEAGARGAVIKSHQGDTSARAYLANRYRAERWPDSSFALFGSITLNAGVGGLNAAAVESALAMGARVVWLPTVSAENHLRRTGRTGETPVAVTCGGAAVPELGAIFSLVRSADAVLCTGHIAPEECFIVAGAARRAGVEKLVVTHPEWWLVGMSPEDQLAIVNEYGVILERCYAQNTGVGAGNRYVSNLPGNLAAIRAVGYKNVLISTDGGQAENPPWEQEEADYLAFLAHSGVPEEQLRYMSRELPAMLLGLDT